ncbi:MAG: amino acid ABC transporter permease [Propionibacteriaceae bacterium]|nr:amino acid ABC transporter permease [Propionibacteriaceae bacterium]
MIAIWNVVGVLVLLALVAGVGYQLWLQGQLASDKWFLAIQRGSWIYYLLPGLLNTIKAAIVAIIGAFIFGLLFGVGRLSNHRVIRWVSSVVVEFFRAVPVLLMMIFLWTALPPLYTQLGLVHPPDPSFLAVVIALILYNGSVCADLVRSGVQNLPAGQHEASAALGMLHRQALLHVLVPQALLAMLPALIAQLVVALKDSALGYIISYSELLRQAKLLGTPLNTLQSLTVAAIIFILINYGLGRLGFHLAQRMKGRTSPLQDEAAEDIPVNVPSISAEQMLASVDQDGYSNEHARHEPPRWPDATATTRQP